MSETKTMEGSAPIIDPILLSKKQQSVKRVQIIDHDTLLLLLIDFVR